VERLRHTLTLADRSFPTRRAGTQRARGARVRFLLLVSLLSSGCYLSHRLPPEPEGRREDAGVASALDAGTLEIDAGSPRCSLVPFGEVQVRDARTHYTQAPDIVWNGDGVTVVMAESGGDLGHSFVSMANVSADLTSVSEHVVAGDEAHGWGEVARIGDALGLCWSGDPGSRTVKTLYRSIAAGALGPRVDHDLDGEACLDLAAAGDRLLMLWRRRVDGGEVIATLAQVIRSDGAPVGEPIELARGEYPGRSALVTTLGDSFFAAVSSADGAVRVLEVSREGAVANEATVAIDDARGAAIAAAHDRVALVVLSGPQEARSSWLATFDRSLARRGTPRRLTDGAPSAIQPAIAPLPDGWLVAWSEEHQPSTAMILAHVDVDGAPREPRIVAHRGDNSGYGGPSIAVDGSRAYVALSHEIDGMEPEQVFVQGWRCDPGEEDPCAPEEVLPAACEPEPVGWYWDGRECVALHCPSFCGGEDCDRLAPSRFACLADRSACTPPRSCEPLEVIDRACMNSRVIGERVGERTIRVERTVECACATELACNVRVAAPFELTLETSACERAVACACERGVVGTTCHLPALSAGTWTISSPGLAPFPIEVRAPWESFELAPFCTDDE
jgi:hypothetical protein